MVAPFELRGVAQRAGIGYETFQSLDPLEQAQYVAYDRISSALDALEVWARQKK